MENASKALIIAGSVLVVILLIAFGLKVLNSTQVSTETSKAKMNTAAASSFNNKFMPYIGNNKTKSQLISLVNLAVANNAASSHKVSITMSTVSASSIYNPKTSIEEYKTPNDLLNKINSSTDTKFLVYITNVGMKEGYISDIYIKKAE